MANKSVYQSYDQAALVHFGLESAPLYGVFSSSEVHNVLVTDSETTYSQIKDLLKKDTVNASTFKNKKKAFLLPKSPISLDRVKAACKEHNITVTNDYEAADLILTHGDFSERFEHGVTIKSTVMMCKLWNYHTIESSAGHPTMDNYINTEGNNIIIDTRVEEHVNRYQYVSGESVYDNWLISGMAVNLAHKIDTGEIDTIGVETVVCESANKTVLTEDLMKDLTTQLSSYNEEDKAMAGMMIPTLDYTKNYHLLWQLARNVDHKMYHFNRNKDVQYWLSVSNFNRFSNMNAENMIEWLDERELLNTESFRYLEPIVRKEITIHNRALYVFKVEVKPEYRKYLKKRV